MTILKFVDNIRVGFNKAFVPQGIALSMFGSPFEREAERFYSSYISAGVRMNRKGGTVSSGVIQTYTQRYLKDLVFKEAANCVTPIRQKANEDENMHVDRSEIYATECSSADSDYVLVNYDVQGLLPVTGDTIREALHRRKVDISSSLSNVVRLAQVEGQMYRARKLTYGIANTVAGGHELFALNAVY